MRDDIPCQCFFCQGFPQNFTHEEIHDAAQELAVAQRSLAEDEED